MACDAATYQFALVKGAERYLVRCASGSEEAAIAQLMRWASNPDLEFDWFDAAVLARQINLRLLDRTVGEASESVEDENSGDR
jgi:hypothetical protein